MLRTSVPLIGALGVLIMVDEAFKYDVAFSFLKDDEGFAVEIDDLIHDRVATFLYSRRQGELAGTDGELSFNDVFASTARIVVVLYRSAWGQTPWTRIEETAIRNRAFEQGYDFVIFVPLDGSPLPKWLPKTQIWVGLDRWGARGAAAVIEARVQDAGGAPRSESIQDKAARLKRAADHDTDRKQFFHSEKGVLAAREEIETFRSVIERKTNEIKVASEFQIIAERVGALLEVTVAFGCLSIEWYGHYANTLDQSYLAVSIWSAKPPRPGRVYFDAPHKVREVRYELDKARSGVIGWRAVRDGEVVDPESLADYWLGHLMEHSLNEKRKRPR